MRELFQGTLVENDPWHAVTFVDNHDTEPGQSLESFVLSWFKPQAYALILLRIDGLPCVFYGDLYGIPAKNIPAVAELPTLMKIRELYAYGEQHDYFDDSDIIGWTRSGIDEFAGSGLAVVLSIELVVQRECISVLVMQEKNSKIFLDTLAIQL